MSGAPFHLTRMGARFFEATLPGLVRQIDRLNQNLERIANHAERDGSAGDQTRNPDGERDESESEEDDD